MMQLLWKLSLQSLIELNICLLYNPDISFLGVYPIEMTLYVQKKTNMRILMVALFIIASNQK